MKLEDALKLYEGQEGIEEIKSLIKKGINEKYPNEKIIGYKINIKNMCPIHIAAEFGYIEIIEALIENGADINIKGRYDYTALHEACQSDKIDIVKILIKNGADVNIKNDIEQTALYYALEYSNEEIADILIKNGANLGLEPNHNVQRLDLPYREEEYFIERTSANIAFNCERDELSEPCEMTADVPFYFENMPQYSTIYVSFGAEKKKHKEYLFENYYDFYGETSHCEQYNNYMRKDYDEYIKKGLGYADFLYYFRSLQIYQQEITDGKNYFIITHFALMSRKIDKEFILWLVKNFNLLPVEEGTMNSFDDLNKIKLCKKGVTYYLSYGGSLYAFMTMDKYIFVVCEIRDLSKRSKQFMRLAIYMTGERYCINRKLEFLEEEEKYRIEVEETTIKKYSRRYLKFIKEVSKYLEIKGYKKNEDYHLYSDEYIIESMSDLHGYDYQYTTNIELANDIIALKSQYKYKKDKSVMVYYFGLDFHDDFDNKKIVKNKIIKIKNDIEKIMFEKFKYKVVENRDLPDKLFYQIKVKKDNPEEIAEAMIELDKILKSKKIKNEESEYMKEHKKSLWSKY